MVYVLGKLLPENQFTRVTHKLSLILSSDETNDLF